MIPPDADQIITHDAASCALWWQRVPAWPERQLGLIGCFTADDQAAADTLLTAACSSLRAAGCSHAIGPIDGNTWRPYRFVTWTDGTTPFLLERQQPAAWPEWWQAHGFTPWQTYRSSVHAITDTSERIERCRARLTARGLRLRSMNAASLASELPALHAFCCEAFANNVLYSPLDEAEFTERYLPFADRIDPRLALIAEMDGVIAGFVFALPDLGQAQAGEPIDRLVIKTLAASPARHCAGLGVVLVDTVEQAARAMGIPKAVHAYMHDANNSANIGRTATVFRRYTLFSKQLQG